MQIKSAVRSSIAIVATSLLAVVGFTAPVSAASLVEKTYVVLVPNESLATGNELVADFGGDVGRQFKAVRTRTAKMTPTEAAALDAVPGVIVEENKIFSIAVTNTQYPTPSWGLDRIDQVSLPRNSTFNYSSTDQGPGVKAYIIDTGVNTSHSEFTGRISGGYDGVGDGNGFEDCNGHGTHVAGTVAGNTVGVAREALIVPVRVLDCSGAGSTTSITAGINYAVADHQPGTPAVANMSLGGGASSIIDSLTQSLINDGITTVVAAGNGNNAGVAQDACTTSPARVSAAITVGATTSTDYKASYSNYGTCLDIFAPGSSIYSSWLSGGYNTISGTSMATPHVTGVAARYLSVYPTASPATVAAAITGTASTGKVISAGTGSPNRLLYLNPTGFGTAAVSLPPAPLSAPNSATVSITGFGSANATWAAPTSTGGETVTGYLVTPVVSGVDGAPVTTTGTSRSFTGQTAGATFSVKVAAITASAPTGGPAATSNQVTIASQATAPQNLAPRKISSSKTTLSWQAPSSLGYSTLVRYEINRSTNGGATWSTSWTSAGTSTSYTFSGQKTGTNYAYKVRAYTVAGPGLESSTVTQVQAVSTNTRNGRTR